MSKRGARKHDGRRLALHLPPWLNRMVQRRLNNHQLERLESLITFAIIKPPMDIVQKRKKRNPGQPYAKMTDKKAQDYMSHENLGKSKVQISKYGSIESEIKARNKQRAANAKKVASQQAQQQARIKEAAAQARKTKRQTDKTVSSPGRKVRKFFKKFRMR